ncbi:hypothetical protein FHG87_009050 [Trinorchestia longiramus]|nr:hypothetical protein FHG87_009050 [Trinorchestia longiramus]
MYRVLKEDLGKKLSKMMKRHELTEHHERMRAEKSRNIFNKIAQGFTMEFPTGFSTITGLQRNPNLDLEEHSISHKQRCMASKELRPQSLGLFYLVHFGDNGLSYPSHFSRVPQSKTATGMGSNSTRTDNCRL